MGILSTVEESLANTTGEIMIKPMVERVCYNPDGSPFDFFKNNLDGGPVMDCEGSGKHYFYLTVRASRHPREPSRCPRSARLFLMVSGKVLLGDRITYMGNRGGLHKTHRLVGRDKNISRHQFHEISVLMFEPQIILLDSGWK